MKLSKKELMQKISDNIEDEELVISLLEDIEDSMNENASDVIDTTKDKELEDLKWKYEDLKLRYKERFLGNEDIKEDKEELEELKEEKIFEDKDIFEIKEED